MKDVLAFSLGRTHPSSRLRIAAYAGALERAGWRLELHHFDPGMGKVLPPDAGYVARLFYRARRGIRTMKAAARLRRLDPRQPIIISRELPVRRRPFLESPNPMVLDVDDAVYVGADRTGFDALCRRARVVVCGNKTLADDLVEVAPRRVIIPTVVDTDLYSVRMDHRAKGALRVGWLGSSMSLDFTLAPLLEMIREAQRRLGFDLVVISDESPGFIRENPWVKFVRWSPEAERAAAEHFDIGIMPLQDNAFQAAKCGAKLLQYMAAGLPVVASPVGVNREIVLHGATGFLATTPDEWQSFLERLAGDEALRASFGKSGRRHVEENYSVARWAAKWVEVLEEVSAAATGALKPAGLRQ